MPLPPLLPVEGVPCLCSAHSRRGRQLFCSLAHAPFVLQAEHELRVAQTEFDRQAEVTRLLLEGISSTHVSDSSDLGFLPEGHQNDTEPALGVEAGEMTCCLTVWGHRTNQALR